MANIKSAIKRNRQNKKRRFRNKSYSNLMKTSIKKLLTSVEKKNKDEAKELLKKTISIIDSVRVKGIIHRNNASRKISRLTRLVNKIS